MVKEHLISCGQHGYSLGFLPFLLYKLHTWSEVVCFQMKLLLVCLFRCFCVLQLSGGGLHKSEQCIGESIKC